MKQWLWAALAGALVLGAAAPAAMAGSNPNAVIALHIVSQEKATGTCDAYLPFSCMQFETNVSTPGDYNIYVTVSKYDTVGIAGLQFGVEYNEAPGAGFDISNWVTCGDLNFPMVGWPNSDTGTLMTWEPTYNCKGADRTRDYPICAGVFQVYANGDDSFQVIPRPADGRAKVADCLSAENDITFQSPSRLGVVTYGAQPGYNPCSIPTSVERTTWGSIKTLYEQ